MYHTYNTSAAQYSTLATFFFFYAEIATITPFYDITRRRTASQHHHPYHTIQLPSSLLLITLFFLIFCSSPLSSHISSSPCARCFDTHINRCASVDAADAIARRAARFAPMIFFYYFLRYFVFSFAYATMLSSQQFSRHYSSLLMLLPPLISPCRRRHQHQRRDRVSRRDHN